MSDPGEPRRQARIESLLGLRGIAALIVVIHHCMLRLPVFSEVYAHPHRIADVGSAAWWMVQTPLHLVWAGGEAVFVFFVLSGFVLTLPLLRDSRFNWLAYYPSRLIRLYVPVWASILFAVCLFAVTRTISPHAGSEWAAERHISLGPVGIVEQSIILHNADVYNGPLWSIVWEVLFSLLLPLYFVVLVKLRLGWGWKLTATFAAVAVGAYVRSDIPAAGNLLMYMAMFAIGVIMATKLEQLRDLATRIDESSHSRVFWNGLVVVGLLALCAYWFVLLGTSNLHVLNVSYTIQLAGATVLIFCAIFDRRIRGALEVPAVRWLGTVSFSLYLVHDPILVALDYLTGSHLLVFVIGIPLSLCVGWLFYLVVERPSHRLSRWTGRRLRRREANLSDHTGSDGRLTVPAGES